MNHAVQQYNLNNTHQKKESILSGNTRIFSPNVFVNTSSFDELIKKSCENLNVEFEIVISNNDSTEHGIMQIVGGKIHKTLLLVEICILSSVTVLNSDNSISGYIVEYYIKTSDNTLRTFISCDTISKNMVNKHLNIINYYGEKKERLSEKLVQFLITDKANNSQPVKIGSKQGWNFNSDNTIKWETRNNYTDEIKSIIPESILLRKKALETSNTIKNTKEWEISFLNIFNDFTHLKFHLLVRLSSYMLSFASKLKINFNQIILVKPTFKTPLSLLEAVYDNVNFGVGKTLLLSKKKDIEHAENNLNDAIMLVIDDTKHDEIKKRDAGINILRHRVLDSKTDYLQIPVVISEYADSQLESELFCDFTIPGRLIGTLPHIIIDLLEMHDYDFIQKIEKNHSEWINDFYKILIYVQDHIPSFIPPEKRNAFCILEATLTFYNRYFLKDFFGEIIEKKYSICCRKMRVLMKVLMTSL